VMPVPIGVGSEVTSRIRAEQVPRRLSTRQC